MKKTYDVVFNDNENSNSKGFAVSKKEAIAYIKENNGTDTSYFPDYLGGLVGVICNETGKVVYLEEVR